MPSAKTGSHQIVEVEAKKNVTLYTLDNGEILTLSHSVGADFYLYRQKIVSEDDLKAIKLAQQKRTLFEYALKKMRGKYLSEATVTSLLFDFAENPSLIASVMSDLKKKQYIDDVRFGRQLLETCQNKHYGNDKILEEFKKARIKETVVKDLKLTEEDEYQRGLMLVPILEKKLLRNNYRQKKSKVYQQLMRYGYQRDNIQLLINHLSEIDDEVESSLLKKDYDKAYVRYQKKYDKQELFRHIMNYLLTKGYTYKDIKALWEGHNDDMD